MEERRAEQRGPADRRGPRRHQVQVAGAAGVGELEHRAAHDRDTGCGPHARELALESPRERDVVGIEPGDIPAARLVEPAVQRRCQAQALVVPQHAQARVADLVEDRGRRVLRAVVDDEQLEVGHALAQDALERCPDVALTVRDGEQNRHERGGLHGRLVAYGSCRGSFRRSISSSRRWGGRTSWGACFARSRRRRTATCGCSSSIRTPTTGSTPCSRERSSRCCVSARSRVSRARGTRRSLTCGRMWSASRTTTVRIPPDLLERVASRLAGASGPDGVTGRAADSSGRSSASWRSDAAVLTETNLWNRAISFTIFLRREVVEQVGTVRRAARARLAGAVGVRGGDRLPGAGRPGGGADRVRPVARRPARPRGRGHRHGVSGRRERWLPASQARLPRADACADARAAARRSGRLDRPPRPRPRAVLRREPPRADPGVQSAQR